MITPKLFLPWLPHLDILYFEVLQLLNILNALVEKHVKSVLFHYGVRSFSNILCLAKSELRYTDKHWSLIAKTQAHSISREK